MPEVLEAKKRGRGRPPGAKNKPKPPVQKQALITEAKVLQKLGFSSLKINRRIAKELSRLTESTGFTLQRVYDDMCEAGIIDIQSMYLEVINARRDMQKALDALDGKTTAQAPNKQEPAVRNGETNTPVRRIPREPDSDPERARGLPAQPNVAPIGRGLGPPPPTDPEDSFSVGLTDDEPEPEEPEEEEPENGNA